MTDRVDHKQAMLTLARAYCEVAGLRPSTIATQIRNDGKFFQRIENGSSCTVETYEDVLQWFSRHWPATLPWPKGIMRP